ncbi:MAG: ribonucleotide reductase subunit alpha [Amphritea sp.]|nr:ribonucleotide reductase subunit alpha [Amphritea sp.]
MISKFSDLLEMAQSQDQPQRLLMLFALAEGGSSNPKKQRKKQHGTIAPVMCVDKLPEEVESFSALVAEADQISSDWNFVIIAGLSGENGVAPTTEDADPYLNQMANGLTMGEDLSRYLIFDREENPIVMQ